VRYRRFRLIAPLALFLSSSALLAMGTVPVRSFDATTATPAEVTRGVHADSSGALVRLKGLRGADGEALTFDLEPAPLFSADFHLYVDGRDRGRDIAARLTMLRGTVEEWPGSSVSLSINGATGAWSGYVAADGQLYEVALPAGAAKASVADSVTVRRAAPESISKGFLPDALEPPPGMAKELGRAREKVVAAPGAEYEAKIAIESDYELFQLFGTVEGATDYIAGVIAGVSEVYFRHLGVALAISSVSLYTTPNDPWNAPNPHSGDNAEVLCEFSSFWQKSRPVAKFPRNGAVFFTAKHSEDIGGQAWVSSLCNYKAKPSSCPYGGYGIVVSSARKNRDLFLVAHELGHVFGSHHTHCYDPPIDGCYSGERGCYSGPETAPGDGGSVMSYCNPAFLSLGERGRYGLDSQRVVEVMSGFVGSVGPSCLGRTNDPYEITGEGAPGSATLSWIDPFSTETAWIVEQRLANGKFKPLKPLPANTTSFTVTKLKPGANAFRVRAKFKKDFSDYSSLVTVTVP
jgi:hypothetical protein